jgi:DNA mismatch repair protein MutS2
VDDLVEKIEEPLEKAHFESLVPKPLRVGDRVYINRLGKDGIVSSIAEDEVDVQIGKMRVKVDLRDIERSKNGIAEDSEEEAVEIGSGAQKEVFYPSPGTELHLRGMRAEDALESLDSYLDAAYSAGLPYVRIVHGKGTGTLRSVVRKALDDAELVERWELALDSEGGEGVTVAFLREG